MFLEKYVNLPLSNVPEIVVGILIEGVLEDRLEYAISDLESSYPYISREEAISIYLFLRVLASSEDSVTELLSDLGYEVLVIKGE